MWAIYLASLLLFRLATSLSLKNNLMADSENDPVRRGGLIGGYDRYIVEEYHRSDSCGTSPEIEYYFYAVKDNGCTYFDDDEGNTLYTEGASAVEVRYCSSSCPDSCDADPMYTRTIGTCVASPGVGPNKIQGWVGKDEQFSLPAGTRLYQAFDTFFGCVGSPIAGIMSPASYDSYQYDCGECKKDDGFYVQRMDGTCGDASDTFPTKISAPIPDVGEALGKILSDRQWVMKAVWLNKTDCPENPTRYTAFQLNDDGCQVFPEGKRWIQEGDYVSFYTDCGTDCPNTCTTDKRSYDVGMCSIDYPDSEKVIDKSSSFLVPEGYVLQQMYSGPGCDERKMIYGSFVKNTTTLTGLCDTCYFFQDYQQSTQLVCDAIDFPIGSSHANAARMVMFVLIAIAMLLLR